MNPGPLRSRCFLACFFETNLPTLLVALALLAIVPDSDAQDATEKKAKTWNANGSTCTLGQRLLPVPFPGMLCVPEELDSARTTTGCRLRLTEKRLQCETRDEIVAEIPLAGITELIHAVETRRPVREHRRQLRKDIYDPEKIEEMMAMDPLAAMGIPFLPGLHAASEAAMLLFVPIKRSLHYVTITWELDGQVRQNIYRMRGKDATSLLQALQRATGLAWQTIDLGDELEASRASRQLVRLNRYVGFGNTFYPPGIYELALVERRFGQGRLYLYVVNEADATRATLIGGVSVTISDAPAEGGCEPVFTHNQDSTVRVESLCVGSRLLQIIRASPL